jgi:hypothetical protein
MSKMLDMVAFEHLLYLNLDEAYGHRHANTALQFLADLCDKLDLDDYLDILEWLVDNDIDLDDELHDLISYSPVRLY